MKSKIWVILALAAIISMIASFSLIGCKEEAATETATEEVTEEVEEEATEEAEEAEEEVPPEPVVIDFWTISGTSTNMVQAMTDLYTAANPHVTFNISPVGQENMQNLIKSAVASGQEKLDMFYGSGDMHSGQPLANAGFLLNLSPYYEELGWYERSPEAALEILRSKDGNMYFVSAATNLFPFIFYNKDIFAEVGIEPATSSAELMFNSMKLREAGYKALAFGNNNRGPSMQIFGVLASNFMTQEERDINKGFAFSTKEEKLENMGVYSGEGMKKALEMFEEWTEAGVFLDEANVTDIPNGRLLFTSGEAGMFSWGHWTVKMVRDEAPDLNLGVSYFPGFERQGAFYAGSFTVPSYVSEEKIPAIIDFLDTMYDPEYALEVYKSGLFSPSKELTVDDLLDVLDPVEVELIKHSQEIGTIVNIKNFMEPGVIAIVQDAVSRVIGGTMTADEALGVIAEKIEEFVNEIIE